MSPALGSGNSGVCRLVSESKGGTGYYHMTILIVGAGLSGCVLAEKYASLGKEVVIIEKRSHIAGNCYDYIDENGILINLYGPHFFHTNSERVWEYINQFSKWVEYRHRVLGRYKDKVFPIPINIKTVNALYDTTIKTGEEMKEFLKTKQVDYNEVTNSEELGLSRFGQELFTIIIKGYTEKQWNKHPRELDPSVVGRIPIRYSEEDGYFSDKYQVLPEKGYTEFCRQMLNHPTITVQTDTDFVKEDLSTYEKVFFTGRIDQYFKEAGLEELEYRSLRFEKESLPIEYFQETSQVNYTDVEVPFTRIVEYKHLLNQKSKNTTIVKEYPSDEGEPYYPVPSPRNTTLYELYKSLAKKEEEKGVYFVGRLANYKYFNMDEAILNALELFKSLESLKSH